MSTRRSQIVLGLILVASILTLTPLAYADPPDPTWVTGFWDDDDFDDVVGYITSAAGWLPAPVACDLRPAELPTVPRLVAFQVAVSAPRPTSRPRAPPTL
jgi:hypothetical protein